MTFTIHVPMWCYFAATFAAGMIVGAMLFNWIAGLIMQAEVGRAFGW